MNDASTLYDQAVRKLKNNKVVVLVLLGFTVLGAVAQVYGVFSGIISSLFPPKTHVQVAASIQRYDFMVGKTKAVKPLGLVQGDVTHLQQIADDLAKEIASAMGPTRTSSEVTLAIESHNLHANQPVRASVLVFVPPIVQIGRVPKAVGETDTVDMQPLFGDPQFVDPRYNSIDMELEPCAGGYQREPLKIFKRGMDFSFDAQRQESRKTISKVAQTRRGESAAFS